MYLVFLFWGVNLSYLIKFSHLKPDFIVLGLSNKQEARNSKYLIGLSISNEQGDFAVQYNISVLLLNFLFKRKGLC